jgi:hypothetical protein
MKNPIYDFLSGLITEPEWPFLYNVRASTSFPTVKFYREKQRILKILVHYHYNKKAFRGRVLSRY